MRGKYEKAVMDKGLRGTRGKRINTMAGLPSRFLTYMYTWSAYWPFTGIHQNSNITLNHAINLSFVNNHWPRLCPNEQRQSRPATWSKQDHHPRVANTIANSSPAAWINQIPTTQNHNTIAKMNSRPMKHIDREDLYTNLEARVQYLHSFLDFSSRTCRLRLSQQQLN